MLNDQWEVVALHHSGSKTDDKGNYLKADGSVWTDDDGLDAIAGGQRGCSGKRHRQGPQEATGQLDADAQALLDTVFQAGEPGVEQARPRRRHASRRLAPAVRHELDLPGRLVHEEVEPADHGAAQVPPSCGERGRPRVVHHVEQHAGRFRHHPDQPICDATRHGGDHDVGQQPLLGDPPRLDDNRHVQPGRHRTQVLGRLRPAREHGRLPTLEHRQGRRAPSEPSPHHQHRGKGHLPRRDAGPLSAATTGTSVFHPTRPIGEHDGVRRLHHVDEVVARIQIYSTGCFKGMVRESPRQDVEANRNTGSASAVHSTAPMSSPVRARRMPPGAALGQRMADRRPQDGRLVHSLPVFAFSSSLNWRNSS